MIVGFCNGVWIMYIQEWLNIFKRNLCPFICERIKITINYVSWCLRMCI